MQASASFSSHSAVPYARSSPYLAISDESGSPSEAPSLSALCSAVSLISPFGSCKRLLILSVSLAKPEIVESFLECAQTLAGSGCCVMLQPWQQRDLNKWGQKANPFSICSAISCFLLGSLHAPLFTALSRNRCCPTVL